MQNLVWLMIFSNTKNQLANQTSQLIEEHRNFVNGKKKFIIFIVSLFFLSFSLLIFFDTHCNLHQGKYFLILIKMQLKKTKMKLKQLSNQRFFCITFFIILLFLFISQIFFGKKLSCTLFYITFRLISKREIFSYFLRMCLLLYYSTDDIFVKKKKISSFSF